MSATTGAGDTPLMLAQRTSTKIAEILEYRLNSI